MSDNLEYEKPNYSKYRVLKDERFGRPKPAPKPSSTKKRRGRPSKEEKVDD
jgi:hypothetical protein